MCILDNDGNRILAKYYDKNVLATVKEQKAFEKNLFNKTHRAASEIIMLDGLTCVYKNNVDLFFYVMGSTQENELILLSVLNCLYDSISLILKKNVEKRAVLDNLDIIMLAFDEICDGGCVTICAFVYTYSLIVIQCILSKYDFVSFTESFWKPIHQLL